MFQLTSSSHPGAAKEKVVDAAFLVASAKTSPHHKSHCSLHKSIMLKPLMKHASKAYSAWRVGVARHKVHEGQDGFDDNTGFARNGGTPLFLFCMLLST